MENNYNKIMVSISKKNKEALDILENTTNKSDFICKAVIQYREKETTKNDVNNKILKNTEKLIGYAEQIKTEIKNNVDSLGKKNKYAKQSDESDGQDSMVGALRDLSAE